MTDSFEKVFEGVERVLVVLAHPDDAEVACGGTIARLAKTGRKVRLVVTTNGGKGVKDKEGLTEEEFAAGRIKEQKKAGTLLGISEDENFNLQIPDGELETDIKTIEKVVYHIREFKPDLVITHNPENFVIKFNEDSAWVNHRDHRHTGEVVLDAMYPYSRDRGFFPEHFEKGLTQHSVNKVLINDSYQSKDALHLEITDVTEQKLSALRNHPSALNPNDAEDYLSENEIEGKYFEPFVFRSIY